MKTFAITLALFLCLSASIAQTDFQNFLTYAATLDSPAAKTAAVDSFMAYARGKGIPLMQDSAVTFLYRGNNTSAFLSGDMNGWATNATPMNKLTGTNLFYYSTVYEKNARLDYKFILDVSNWILDPLNPRQIPGGYGPNSELAMPAYIQPWEIQYFPSKPHGTLAAKTIHSTNVGANYSLSIYFPPGYDTTKRYPAVYFQDGSDYLNYGMARNVLDNLIDSNKIEPVIGIFVTPNNRNEEYAGSIRTQYRLFFVNELVPFIDSLYPTERLASRRLVVGDSYGGNISALIVLYHSDIFGNIGIHSGAFQPYNYEVCSLFLTMPTVDVKIASVWGLYEGSLTQNMRDVRDTLLNRGYELTCKEVPEGHSWGEWRANTDFILEYIFPALPTGVADRKSGKPKEFQLSQNYPNPFNPSTTISYSLPDAGFVSLKVYSLLGQEVSTLVNRVQESGNHSIRFNADKLPSGVYLYRLNVQSGKGQISYIRKMILLK